MSAETMFEPSLRGYVSYCVGFYCRYLLAAGGIVLVLHVLMNRHSFSYRIQQSFQNRSLTFHEIRWSLVNSLCTGLSTILMYKLINDGQSSMYFTIPDGGMPYFFLSILLAIVGHDTWIYWQHRLLHTPWFFKHAHSYHHEMTNPTAFATFAHHPIETFMGNVYFLLMIVYLPLHLYAFIGAGLYMFGFGIIGHVGYEFYPRGWTRHPLFGWINPSTHHNMHHSHPDCNYTNWFNYWDYLMGTNHPDYHDYFDEVTDRRGRPKSSLASRSDVTPSPANGQGAALARQG